MTVGGSLADKPAMLVSADQPIALLDAPRRFVSRGGEKLDAALERFAIEVQGRRCLDAGASTGGFTDCLLQRGAASVTAVDVGYGQLDWKVRSDPRVQVLERTNVRTLSPGDLTFEPDLVVADLSFISLRSVLASLTALASESADLVLLIKPQFEAGRERVGKGGVVRDPAIWADCLSLVGEAAAVEGWDVAGMMASPLKGPAGNVEFLLAAHRGASGSGDLEPMVAVAVAEGEQR